MAADLTALQMEGVGTLPELAQQERITNSDGIRRGLTCGVGVETAEAEAGTLREAHNVASATNTNVIDGHHGPLY